MRGQGGKERRKAAAAEQSDEAVHELPATGRTGDSERSDAHERSDAQEAPSKDKDRARRGQSAAEQAPRGGKAQVAAPESVELQPARFGATLTKARERKGMSIHDVAALTRISARWIAALEQERFEQLPAAVFVVGYVRNLARALGVDSDDLLSRYRAQRQTQDAALATAGSGADRFESAMRQRKSLIFTLFAVAVGLLALLGLFLQRRPT